MVFLSSVNTPLFSAHHARIIKPLPKHLRPVLRTGILKYAKAGFHDSSAFVDTGVPVLPPLKFDTAYTETEVSTDSESERDFSPGPLEDEIVDDTESSLTAPSVMSRNAEDDGTTTISKAKKLIAYISENIGTIRNPSIRNHATLVLDAVLRSKHWSPKSGLGALFVLDMLRDLPEAMAEDAAMDVVIDDCLPLLKDEPAVQYAPAYPADEEIQLAVHPSSNAVAMADVEHHRPAAFRTAAPKVMLPSRNNQHHGALGNRNTDKVRTGADIDALIVRMENCSVTAKPSVSEVIQGLCSLLGQVSMTSEPTPRPASPPNKRGLDDTSSDEDGDDECERSARRPVKRCRSNGSVPDLASKGSKRERGRRAMAKFRHSI